MAALSKPNIMKVGHNASIHLDASVDEKGLENVSIQQDPIKGTVFYVEGSYFKL